MFATHVLVEFPSTREETEATFNLLVQVLTRFGFAGLEDQPYRTITVVYSPPPLNCNSNRMCVYISDPYCAICIYILWYEFTSRMECRVERNSMIPFDMPSPSATIHVFSLGDFTYMLLFNNHTKQSATKQIDMLCVLCSRIKLYRPSPSSFCVFCVSAHFGPCKRFTVSPMSYQHPLLCRPVFSVCLHRHARLCFQVQSEYEVMMLVVHVHVSDS